MGNQASVPERVYKAAKQNDWAALKDLLREFQEQSPGQNPQASKLLEYKDSSSWTPLVAAAARANYASADLLLQHGANIHYVTNLPEASTALHEAVQRSHDGIVELLLRYGGNAFLENGRGLTSIDVAINNRHVKLVRRLEQRSFFAGWLLMKVPKYMGLGSEWKSRWCVAMPRYPNPGAPRSEQVVRTLLVCYKGIDQAMPCCKVWLDGANARTVTGSRGSNLLQCMLALHQNHSPPTGAHMTGDAQTGFSLHLRPIDDTNAANVVLRRFMDVCNGNRQPSGSGAAAPSRQPSIAEMPAQPAPQQQSSTSARPPAPPRQSVNGPAAAPPISGPPPLAMPPPASMSSGRIAAPWGPPAGSSIDDEAFARQLQAQFDAEEGPSGMKQGPPGIPARPPPSWSSPYPSPAAPGPASQPSSLQSPARRPSSYANPASNASTSQPMQPGYGGAGYSSTSANYGAGCPGQMQSPGREPYPTLDGPLGQSLASNNAASLSTATLHGRPDSSREFTTGQSSAANSSNPYAPPQPSSAASEANRGRQSHQHSGSGNDVTAQFGDLDVSNVGQGRPVADSNPQGSWWNQLPSAPQPPAAAQDVPGRQNSGHSQGSPDARAPTGQGSIAAMQDDDSDMCVVCMEQPCVAGFVHGNSVHKCCCKECAEDYKRSGNPTCPICREPIEHIITRFY